MTAPLDAASQPLAVGDHVLVVSDDIHGYVRGDKVRIVNIVDGTTYVDVKGHRSSRTNGWFGTHFVKIAK